MTVTTTIGLGGGDATTRALSVAGVKTFEVGDQIALKYEQDGSYDMQKAVATAQNISADGKSATFTFTLDNPQSNSDMFPAIACTILFFNRQVNAVLFSSNAAQTSGRLAFSAINLDYRSVCTTFAVN